MNPDGPEYLLKRTVLLAPIWTNPIWWCSPASAALPCTVSGSLKDELKQRVTLGVVCDDLNDEPNKKCHKKEYTSNTSYLRNHLGQVIQLELQTCVLRITMYHYNPLPRQKT